MNPVVPQLAPPKCSRGTTTVGVDAGAALIADATPKILAELYVIERSTSGLDTKRGEIPFVDIEPIVLHILALRTELRDLVPDTAIRDRHFGGLFVELDALIQSTRSYGSGRDSWKPSDLLEFCSSARRILCDFNRIGPSRTQRPLAPGIELLEFDTEFSGVVDEIVGDVVALEECFLIDPKLKMPQNGFGRVEDAREIRTALSLCESRLFATTHAGKILGFFICENNQLALRSKRGDIIQKLQSGGYLGKDERVSFVRILGVRQAVSRISASVGNDLYAQLMEAVDFSHRGDGISLGIGLVREGDNANTAMFSHKRVGWSETDIVVYGPDNKTPYRVIVRQVVNPSLRTEYPVFGLGSHFMKWEGHPGIKHIIPESAGTLLNSRAVEICRSYFSEHYPSCETFPLIGMHGMALQFRSGARMCSLIQLRPRTDAWRLEVSETMTGKLEDLLAPSLNWLVDGR